MARPDFKVNRHTTKIEHSDLKVHVFAFLLKGGSFLKGRNLHPMGANSFL